MTADSLYFAEYLCRLSANRYKVEFLEISIRDASSKGKSGVFCEVLLEISQLCACMLRAPASSMCGTSQKSHFPKLLSATNSATCITLCLHTCQLLVSINIAKADVEQMAREPEDQELPDDLPAHVEDMVRHSRCVHHQLPGGLDERMSAC